MIAKTKRQVLLLILVPLVLSVVVAASFFWMRQEVADAVQLHQTAEEVEKSVLGLNQVISQYLLHPEERPQVQFGLIYRRLTKSLARLQPGTERERQLVAKMHWESETIWELFPLLTSQGRGSQASREGLESSERGERIIGQLLISSEEIWQSSFQLVKIGSGRMAASVNKTMAFATVAVLFSGAIIVGLAFFIGRGIVGTQKNLEKEIAERRQAEEALQKAHDELENRVTERTRQLSAEVEEHKRTEESLRETQEELRLLSTRILSAQENERRKIAGELHDHIWQILNRVILKTHHLISHSDSVDPIAVRSTAEIILGDTREAIEKIRSLQGELWPPVLDDLGILATFSWYLRRFGEEHPGITIDKQIEVAEEDVPLSLKIVIYRVLQESLRNAARHSGAGRVRVSLKKDDGCIAFAVEDDGSGFDLKQVLFGSATWLGFGLVSIKEKVEQAGGAFDVVSRPGVGTILRASWRSEESRIEFPPSILEGSIQKGMEGRFRIVTQAISDWIYSFQVEAEGRFRPEWITPGFTEVTGFNSLELRDKPDLYWNIHPDDRHQAEERSRRLLALQPYSGEFRIITRDGSVRWIRDACNPLADPRQPGSIKVLGAAQDITERKEAEANQVLLAEILQTLNRSGDLHPIMAEMLRLIREAAGFDAVGLRLRWGEEAPYFEQNGFSEEFLQEENFLCERGGAGAVVRDAEGRIRLECTCGLVLSGTSDPTLPFFTAGGSFWTNASRELLALPPEDDPRNNPRNRCIHAGYQSVGLFPIRTGPEIVGLLQLNDRRSGRFTPGAITFYETLAQNIGLALQRVEAVEALRESERQYRLLFAANPNPMYVFDEETLLFLAVNEAAVRHYGWSREEFLSLSVLDIRPPEDRALARESIQKNRGAQEASIGVRRHCRKDGTVMEMEISSSSIAFAGRPGRLCTMKDVTEWRRVDRELREQREWLRVTLTSIGDAVIAVDVASRITFINPEAEGLTGWEEAEALGQPLASVFAIVNEETGRTLEDPVVRALQEGRVVALANHAVLVSRNGRRVPIEDSAAPILDAAAQVIGAVLVFHDVTGKRRAEEELESLARFPEENPNPVLRIAVGDRLLYANEAARNWLQRGWGWQAGPSLPAPFGALFTEIASPGRMVEQEITCRAGRTFSVTAVNPPNQNYVTVYGRDITDQRRAEKEIRRNLEELQARNEELTRFNRAAVDRELRMIQLKREVNGLCAQTGRPERYKLDFAIAQEG